MESENHPPSTAETAIEGWLTDDRHGSVVARVRKRFDWKPQAQPARRKLAVRKKAGPDSLCP